MTTLSDKMTELANAFRNVFGITDKLGIDSMINLIVGHSSKNLLDKPVTVTGPGYNIEIPVDALPMKYWDKDSKVNVQGTSDTNGFVFNLWSNNSVVQRVTANPSFSVDVDSNAVNGNFHLYFSTGRQGSITITSVKVLGGVIKVLLSKLRLPYKEVVAWKR